MKTFEKQYSLYVCEICGRESKNRDEIKKCEEIHTCKHEPIYSLQTYDDYDDSEIEKFIGIRKWCSICLKEISYIDLDLIEGNNDLIKDIYNLIENHYPEHINENS